MGMFKKAVKHQAKGRAALLGPAGSGKSYTGLNVLSHMCKRFAAIDTERGSLSKYGDLFDFDVIELDSYSPENYIKAIQGAEAEGYDGLLIDSLSHAWMGKDGVLEIVDNAATKARGNSYVGWREGTPAHNRLVDAMLGARLHLFVTMRVKMEHVQEKDERGKTVIRKVGLQPIQRDGLEYEFDVVCDLDMDNTLIVGKTRCPALAGKLFRKPGKDFADVFGSWLAGGAPPSTEVDAAVLSAFDGLAGNSYFDRDEYLAALERFGVKAPADFKDKDTARKCFKEILEAIARREAAAKAAAAPSAQAAAAYEERAAGLREKLDKRKANGTA